MAGLSDAEIRQLMQQQASVRQAARPGLASMPSGVPIPLAGFQGNSFSPNQAGTGIMPQSATGGLMVPPFGEQRLDPAGAPVQPNQGFDWTIQGGSDGQIRSVLLRRMNAKRA